MTVDQEQERGMAVINEGFSSRSSRFFSSIGDLFRKMDQLEEGCLLLWGHTQDSGRQVSAQLEHFLTAPEPYCKLSFSALDPDEQGQSSGTSIVIRKQVKSPVAQIQAGGYSTFVGPSNRDIAQFFHTCCMGLEAGIVPDAFKNLSESTRAKIGQKPSGRDLRSGEWAKKFRREFASQMGIWLFANS